MGPRTYPMRKHEMGRTICVLDVTPNSRAMYGTALLGRELLMVLFTMLNMTMTVIAYFRRYFAVAWHQ